MKAASRFVLACMLLVLASLVVMFGGCASIAPSVVVSEEALLHGIPNMRQVRVDWWRSGQPPATRAAWAWLQRQGFTDVAKFDFPDEGADSRKEEALAAEYGIRVHQFGINPTTEILDALASFGGTELLPPEESTVAKVRDFIVEVMRENANGGRRKVLGHCIHGIDRTGFFLAMVRVINGDMTKAQAEREMLDAGFRKVHWGLWWAWKAWKFEGGR